MTVTEYSDIYIFCLCKSVLQHNNHATGVTDPCDGFLLESPTYQVPTQISHSYRYIPH